MAMVVEALAPNQVFVFGSNTLGDHSGGAALQALKWGAIMGQAQGRQGQTYAIPTTLLGVGFLGWERIRASLFEFAVYAKKHSEEEYLLTPIGTGVAGGFLEDLERVVCTISWPENVVFTWCDRHGRDVTSLTHADFTDEQRVQHIAELQQKLTGLDSEIEHLRALLAGLPNLSIISEQVRVSDSRLAAAVEVGSLSDVLLQAFECLKTVWDGDEQLLRQLNSVGGRLMSMRQEILANPTLQELPDLIRSRTAHLVVTESAVRSANAEREYLELQKLAIQAEIQAIEVSRPESITL
jgi:hypothetical protein